MLYKKAIGLLTTMHDVANSHIMANFDSLNLTSTHHPNIRSTMRPTILVTRFFILILNFYFWKFPLKSNRAYQKNLATTNVVAKSICTLNNEYFHVRYLIFIKNGLIK